MDNRWLRGALTHRSTSCTMGGICSTPRNGRKSFVRPFAHNKTSAIFFFFFSFFTGLTQWSWVEIKKVLSESTVRGRWRVCVHELCERPLLGCVKYGIRLSLRAVKQRSGMIISWTPSTAYINSMLFLKEKKQHLILLPPPSWQA